MEGIWLARPDEVGALETSSAKPPTTGGNHGPLKAALGGTPVAVKDLLDTEGLVTTYGSSLFSDHVPARSAESVRRIEAAGYAVAGKTNLHEFAYGITSQNIHYGTVPNPRHPGRVAGGSSGGSAAAIAAGDVELALGTDSGGSIRIPAAWCGIVGFKPTYDLVPADGCFPLAPSYDHVGPMASSVAGCVELLQALVPEFEPIELDSLDELRVAVAWLEHADPLIAARVEAAVAQVTHPVRLDFPFPDPGENLLFMREVADVHRALFPEHEDEYDERIRTKIERCLEVTEGEAEEAKRLRGLYCEQCADLMEPYDLLLTPTMAFVAPPDDVDEREIRRRGIQFTYPFDSLGWPALALPCGAAEDGLPASVQLVAPKDGDALVLAAGAQLASLM